MLSGTWSLRNSTTAEALEAITDLDPDTLADTEPPRGYSRDCQTKISEKRTT